MRRSAWIIADSRRAEGRPAAAAQYAHSMGLESRRRDAARFSMAEPPASDPSLVLLDYRTLAGLDNCGRERLKNLVYRGATLYVRGGFAEGTLCSLAPFAAGAFRCETVRPATAWQMARDPIVPAVLAGETVRGRFMLPTALGPGGLARPLVLAQLSATRSEPVIFALPHGAGMVIYDMMPEPSSAVADQPLLHRLAEPFQRIGEVGALLAARIAAGRDPRRRPALCITLDDRPTCYDYINNARLLRWLEHLNRMLPGVRLDFAWVPRHSHPASGYMRVLRGFNTGFVWHGLYRHVDHRRLENLDAELERGRAAIASIRSRYGAAFQPILVFPFENFDVSLLGFLARAGFLATVMHPGGDQHTPNGLPAYLQRSGAFDERYHHAFPVLRRYRASELTRDLMIALAALDLPIIVGLHPDEVGLQRWAALMPSRYGRAQLDKVLRFGAEKQLRPESLETIVRETTAAASLAPQACARKSSSGMSS